MKLELRGITKAFGPVVANRDINLVVEHGEIHALLGENGAGKSTLMNVLYGMHQPDEGTILLDDRPVSFSGPGDAAEAGIGMVHQHFMLVPVFTVAESIALGHEGSGAMLDLGAARRRVRELSERFGFDIDPDAVIEDLPVGAQQRVEIIKALSRDAEVLILDEPTAVLTPQETDELIAIMRELAASGTSIVFITHKLREVRAVADRITVIRRGEVVGEADPASTESELAALMVGRSVQMRVDKEPAQAGEVALDVRDLRVVNDGGTVLLDGVDLQVHAGEILGVAGVQGNGQTELTEVLLGIEPADGGTVTLNGTDLLRQSVHQRLTGGLGFVPEDRSTDGVISSFSIAENLVLDQYSSREVGTGRSLSPRKLAAHAEKRVQEYDIRIGSVDDPISTLSGGNAQKVVIAREMGRELSLLVASQPTRGVDVGSIEFIHQQIVAERDAGTPVVIVSTELDEVLALSDRIAVMYRGRVVDVVPGDTDRDVLGLMMAGVPADEARAQVGVAPGTPRSAAPVTPDVAGARGHDATGRDTGATRLTVQEDR